MIEALGNFNMDILVEFNQLKGATTKASKVKEIEEPLAIYYPRCRKKHALHECPLNKTNICILCIGKHVTNECEYSNVAPISVANMVAEANCVRQRMNPTPQRKNTFMSP